MAAKKRTSQKHKSIKFRLREVVFAFTALVAFYVILPQMDQFAEGFEAVRMANTGLILAAGVCIVGAVLSAAAVYKCLALKKIRYAESAITQTAGMFVNRLLPAGIGGMSLSADFLFRRGHTLPQAGAIVLLNNVLTFVGHMTLLACIMLLAGVDLPVRTLLVSQHLLVYIAIIILLTAAMYVISTKYLLKIRALSKEIKSAVNQYQKKKFKVILAFSFAVLNTLGHAAAIVFCIRAFGVDLPFYVALIVLTGGVAAASISPTPGGLFGSEAGLTAVLIGYGVSAGTALAVALSYRLVSYWLPIIPGVLAFYYAGRRKII